MYHKANCDYYRNKGTCSCELSKPLENWETELDELHRVYCHHNVVNQSYLRDHLKPFILCVREEAVKEATIKTIEALKNKPDLAHGCLGAFETVEDVVEELDWDFEKHPSFNNMLAKPLVGKVNELVRALRRQR